MPSVATRSHCGPHITQQARPQDIDKARIVIKRSEITAKAKRTKAIVSMSIPNNEQGTHILTLFVFVINGKAGTPFFI